MDEILYIVLGIAWLAWSFYQNKQKLDKQKAERELQRQREMQQQQQQQTGQTYAPTAYPQQETKQTTTTSRPRNILEELFGEDFSTQREAEPEEYIPETEMYEAETQTYIPEVDEQSWQRKRKVYEAPEAVSQEFIREEVPADYFERRQLTEYRPLEHPKNKIETEEPEVNIPEDNNEKFSLKRAVIYSEILRAPYISG